MKQPSDLKPAGKAFWSRVTKGWRLDEDKLTLLAEACRTLDRAEEARALVDKEGLVQVDRFGQSKPHAALLAERDMRGLFARLVRELGLAPDASDTRPALLRGRYRSRA